MRQLVQDLSVKQKTELYSVMLLYKKKNSSGHQHSSLGHTNENKKSITKIDNNEKIMHSPRQPTLYDFIVNDSKNVSKQCSKKFSKTRQRSTMVYKQSEEKNDKIISLKSNDGNQSINARSFARNTVYDKTTFEKDVVYDMLSTASTEILDNNVQKSENIDDLINSEASKLNNAKEDLNYDFLN